MKRPETSLSPAYFEERYRKDLDPWRFASSSYERHKYQATFAALTKDRYSYGLEVGCSIGVFTQLLADRCDRLLSLDVSETALAACRQRCQGKRNVSIGYGYVPVDWPNGSYDLIVLSEVLYYLNSADVIQTAICVKQSLLPGGEVILVHWLGETDYPLPGNEAADLFIQQLADVAVVKTQDWTAQYRLDLLQRAVEATRIAEGI